MRLLLAWLMLMFLPASPAMADEPDIADTGKSEPIKVMVLGTWHFGNPGQDVVNREAEDVRSPRRQQELAAISAALATFEPNKIMVERVSRSPTLIDQGYESYTPSMLLEKKDEGVQIGYRLAYDLGLGHGQVYAIDEQPSEGEPDYFPFGQVVETAQALQQMDKIAAGMAAVEGEKKTFEAKQEHTQLATLLIEENAATPWKTGISGYYEVLGIGDTENQPGAELNAYWYMRNAKIFAKLMQVSEPGDRILVIFGASHAYWLRHFADEVIGYENVDPKDYLLRAVSETN